MTAISLSPLPLEEFFFAGFLPRKTEKRKPHLDRLKRMDTSIIIMESPYRLGKLLDEFAAAFGKNQLVTLAYNLTMKGEKIAHGSVLSVRQEMIGQKGEFILIIHQ
jgi:16S rRNA (cytidine1402-2'-O)-methyltransferase